MFRYFRFYVAPLTIMAISVGMLFGGIWLWLPAALYIATISALDQAFPHDIDEHPYDHEFFLDLALYLSTPASICLYFALFW